MRHWSRPDVLCGQTKALAGHQGGSPAHRPRVLRAVTARTDPRHRGTPSGDYPFPDIEEQTPGEPLALKQISAGQPGSGHPEPARNVEETLDFLLLGPASAARRCLDAAAGNGRSLGWGRERMGALGAGRAR